MADYTPTPCPLTFPIGSDASTTMSCSFAIADDAEVENTENFIVTAVMAPGMQASFPPGQNTATVNIIDNDGEFCSLLSISSGTLISVLNKGPKIEIANI